ncbi:MAG TPA: hypothetical protein VFR11_15485, partial [Micromonosporaceae bacterium]|nr:hypothetical protein [Micromonosporaceae bacterium]
PGTPEDLVQWVDVRDLGAWLALAGRNRIAGTYDGVGVPVTRAQFLVDVATGVGAGAPRFTWVDDAFLTDHGVNPWAGPRSLPLWLPLPDYGGFLTHDGTAPQAAGLVARPLVDTARDTLEWLRSTQPAGARSAGTEAASGDTRAAAGGDAGTEAASADAGMQAPTRKAGLNPDEEAEVLAAWREARP